MRLPLIKNLVTFIQDNDEDFILEAAEVLEHLSSEKTMKDEELNVIGELISNMFGALEVSKEIKNGASQKEALNSFMKRVMGSIDK